MSLHIPSLVNVADETKIRNATENNSRKKNSARKVNVILFVSVELGPKQAIYGRKLSAGRVQTLPAG